MSGVARFVRHSSGAISLFPGDADFDAKLRDYFQRISVVSPHYRGLIGQCPVSLTDDPVALLGALPATSKSTYRDTLREEALLSVQGASFVTDFSSGSSADPVIRVCRQADDLSEQDATVEAFVRAGMKASDRLVCIDVGAAEIYDFYFRAARSLGVSEVTFLHLTADRAQSLRPLHRLRPTVLLTTPSLLTRLWRDLQRIWGPGHCPVRALIVMGEMMDPEFRQQVRATWGCRVMSFYGTTEIGGFAAECIHEDGHHFHPQRVIPTVEMPFSFDGTTVEGEVSFTALQMHTQSVVKYQVGDIVRISTAPCTCGERTPRLWFLERREDAFVLAGEKFTYAMFLREFRDIVPGLGLMTLEVLDEDGENGKTRLRFTLPQQHRKHERALLALLREGIFELDSLCRYGLVDFELRFEAAAAAETRKLRCVVDHRAASVVP